MTAALCSRCKVNPRASGQRWCAPCRAESKRVRRQAQAGEREVENGEQRTRGNGGEEGESDSGEGDASAKKKGRGGHRPPEDWPERFLEKYRRLGVRWVAAREAKVSHDTVTRAEAADPLFAARVEAARQEYADTLERTLDRLAKQKNNVIAGIVLAKKHRPEDFIERRQELRVDVQTSLSSIDARALIEAMVRRVAPTMQQALAAPGSEGSRVPQTDRTEDPSVAERPIP